METVKPVPTLDEHGALAGGGWPEAVTDRALLTPRPEERHDPMEGSSATERTPLLSGSTAYDPSKDTRPWYRRPSPWWLMLGSFLMAAAAGSTMAPSIEIINLLVCNAVHPDRSPPPQTAFVAAFDSPVLNGGLDALGCRRDPQVQRAMAGFLLGMSLLRGVLAALTVSYWGLLSDRIGRKWILATALFGFGMSDLALIVVVRNYKTLSYHYVLLGSLVEGLLGGYATTQAAFGAYVSDSTPPGSRARILSIMMGTMFAGLSFGPSIGALVVSITHSPLSPFYVSITTTCINILSILAFLPESLTKERKAKAREAWQELKRNATGPRSFGQRVKGWFAFLQPALMFFPRRHVHKDAERMTEEEDDRAALTHGQVEGRRYWALTLVGISYACYVTFYGVMSVKLQYSQMQYGWGPKENAYILTLVGIARVVWLVGLLPLGIRIFKRHAPVHSAADNWNVKPQSLERINKKSRLLYDAHFDLRLAKLSFAVYFTAFAVFILSPGPRSFVFATGLTAAGSGAGPAMQSIALSLCNASDNGKVLSGLSVIQSVFSSTLGPLLYTTVFALSIEVFPQAIFLLAALSMFSAFTVLTFVRLPSRTAHSRESFSDLRRRSGVDLTDEARGRVKAAREQRASESAITVS